MSKVEIQGCAGFLVTDMQEINRKIIWPTLPAVLILANPGPSQDVKPPFALSTPPTKDVC